MFQFQSKVLAVLSVFSLVSGYSFSEDVTALNSEMPFAPQSEVAPTITAEATTAPATESVRKSESASKSHEKKKR